MMLLLCACGTSHPHLGCDVPLDSLRVGDLVFRRGSSLASRMVIRADNDGDYSHVGVLARDSLGRLMVAHAAPGDDSLERVRYESLDSFFHNSRAERGAVRRYSFMDSDSLRGVLDCCVAGIIGRGVSFDNYYDTSDQGSLYCTEFVWVVYGEVFGSIDISCGQRALLNLVFTRGEVILPSHLFNHPSLVTIYSF